MRVLMFGYPPPHNSGGLRHCVFWSYARIGCEKIDVLFVLPKKVGVSAPL